MNTGSEKLNWWVIETLTPHAQAALKGDPEVELDAEYLKARILDLNRESRIETTGFFRGPLRAVEKFAVSAGGSLEIGESGRETAIFVHSGELSTTEGCGVMERLIGPVSMLVPAGASVRIVAVTDALFYVAELEVPPA